VPSVRHISHRVERRCSHKPHRGPAPGRRCRLPLLVQSGSAGFAAGSTETQHLARLGPGGMLRSALDQPLRSQPLRDRVECDLARRYDA
jgi:hypothetical protein